VFPVQFSSAKAKQSKAGEADAPRGDSCRPVQRGLTRDALFGFSVHRRPSPTRKAAQPKFSKGQRKKQIKLGKQAFIEKPKRQQNAPFLFLARHFYLELRVGLYVFL